MPTGDFNLVYNPYHSSAAIKRRYRGRERSTYREPVSTHHPSTMLRNESGE